MYACLRLRGSARIRAKGIRICSLVIVVLCCFLFVPLGLSQESETPPDAPSVAVSEFETDDAVSEEVGDPTTDESPAVDADGAPDTAPEKKASDTRYGQEVLDQLYPSGNGEQSPQTGNDPNTLLGSEGEQTFQDAVVRMIGGLSIVLALILITYYLVRRFGKGIPALSGAQLGQVLGQVHLSRDATLHYVRTGGRVLVIGVNPSGVNLVAEFGASAFDQKFPDLGLQGALKSDAFSDELKSQTDAYTDGPTGDDDVAMLRSDIHRLQSYLREESRESKD